MAELFRFYQSFFYLKEAEKQIINGETNETISIEDIYKALIKRFTGRLNGDISQGKSEGLSLEMQRKIEQSEKTLNSLNEQIQSRELTISQLSQHISVLESRKEELNQSRDAIEELGRQYDMKMDELTELEQKINTMKNKLPSPTKKSEKEGQQVNMQVERL